MIDYSSPEVDARTASDRRTAAIICGVLAGLFGAVMLIYGVIAAVGMARSPKRFDAEDVWMMIVWNLIGVVSVGFALRWLTSARSAGGGAGADNPPLERTGE